MQVRIQAKHVEFDDLKFDSMLEMRFYQRLRKHLGSEVEITREPKVQIGLNKFWKIDFQVAGKLLIEVKGCRDDRLDAKLAAFCRWQFDKKPDFLLVYAEKPYCVPTGITQLNQSAAIQWILARLREESEN